MSNLDADLQAFYASYLDAFHTGEAKAMVPFYHAPCLFIAGQGVMLLATEAEIERLFAQVIEGLKAQNYDHSEVLDLQAKELSDGMVLLSGLAIRFTKTGEELERLSAMYTLRKIDTSWQIVTVVGHSPDTLVRFA